jgi:hypothetical protein
MAKEDTKGNAPAERLVEKLANGGWTKVGITTARSAEAAIDQLTRKSNPDDGNEPGVYRSIPTRFISEEIEVKTEQKTVTSFVTRPPGVPGPKNPPENPDDKPVG